MSQEPGQLVASKYRLIRPLGRGGMGTVWAASHVELDVDVALKFMLAGGALDAGAERRFKREAQAAARLKSPHVVHIHDYGIDQGAPYIAMELLVGADLCTVLGERPTLPLEVAVAWILQAARGLEVVHRAGLVHRDIKPSNLFASGTGEERRIQILDFGLVQGAAHESDTAGETTATKGLIFGSPAYMSPEQARGRAIDQQSDLWSLGAVFFRMLTGRAPFVGDTSADLLVRICTEEVPPPSTVAPAPSDWLPERAQAVDEFSRRALHRDPARRFASLGDFSAALEGLRGPQALPSRPSSSAASSKVGRDEITQALASPALESSAAQSETAPNKAGLWTRPLALGVALLLVSLVFWLALPKLRQGESATEDERARSRALTTLPRSAAIASIQAHAAAETNTPAAAAAANAADNAEPAVRVDERSAPAKNTTPKNATPKNATPKNATRSAPAERTQAPAAPADPLFGLPVPVEP